MAQGLGQWTHNHRIVVSIPRLGIASVLAGVGGGKPYCTLSLHLSLTLIFLISLLPIKVYT